MFACVRVCTTAGPKHISWAFRRSHADKCLTSSARPRTARAPAPRRQRNFDLPESCPCHSGLPRAGRGEFSFRFFFFGFRSSSFSDTLSQDRVCDFHIAVFLHPVLLFQTRPEYDPGLTRVPGAQPPPLQRHAAPVGTAQADAPTDGVAVHQVLQGAPAVPPPLTADTTRDGCW